MSQIISATFEDGVFRPDVKPELVAGAKVQLVVTPVSEDKQANERRVGNRLQHEWDATVDQRQKAFEEMERLRIEHPIDTRGERMTRDELHERR